MPLIPTQTKKKYLTNSEPQLWNIQSQGLKLQCTRLAEGLGTNHAAQQIHRERAAAVKEPSALLKVMSSHPVQKAFIQARSDVLMLRHISTIHWLTKTNE